LNSNSGISNSIECNAIIRPTATNPEAGGQTEIQPSTPHCFELKQNPADAHDSGDQIENVESLPFRIEFSDKQPKFAHSHRG